MCLFRICVIRIMEVVHGTPQAHQFAPQEDFISNMPDDVINNILERMPIQEAVRTGILSKESRYKWTMLTQLVFDNNFYKFLQVTRSYSHYGGIISRLLLHLKGPLTKFVLWIYMNVTVLWMLKTLITVFFF